MAENKKSFLLYVDLIHTVNQLPDDKAGQLFKHILSYVNDENPITDDLITKISFEPIKQQLKRDLKKYENICDRNSNNGKLGGRPKNPKKPKKPTGLFGNPKEPKKADNDNDTDNDNESDIFIKEKMFSDKLYYDPQWVENICRMNKINPNLLAKYLSDFDLKLKSELETKINIQEYASHFSRWLRLEIEKEQKQTKNQKEKLTGAQAFLKQFE
ncbi:MAG: DUF6291 domain-containing protein [Lutibacter sp.]